MKVSGLIAYLGKYEQSFGVVIAQKIMLKIFDDGPLEAVPYVSALVAGLASGMQ